MKESADASTGQARRLSELLGRGMRASAPAEEIRVTGISTDSRAVEAGSLFVALRGTRTDGHSYVREAAARGAAVVMVEDGAAAAGLDVPVVRVENTRRALAEVAARYYGRPADRLSLVGVTGTVGKTSVVAMLEVILGVAGRPAGVVGSLGARFCDRSVEQTGVTSPDALTLHHALNRIVDRGCRLAAMEVTSHALVQERMHGIRLELGVMTNLIPLEHADYHGSFRNYVAAKRRFLDLMRDGAPLVHNADDRTVRRLARDPRVSAVACGRARTAAVRVADVATRPEGTRLLLDVRRPLPGPGGESIAPVRLPVELRLLGRANVMNVALAAASALCLGVSADVVARALPGLPPPRRRMEIIHRDGFLVMDDSVAHPDSIGGVFEVASAFAPRRIYVAYAVRGSRGSRINRENAETFAVWAERVPLGTFVVTRSEGAVDDRNRVTDEEYGAFVSTLRERGIAPVERPRLDDAVPTALEAARDGDLVLLLGAQGMDGGQAIAREWLDAYSRDTSAALRRAP